MKSDILIRPANRKDIDTFFGEPVSVTVRAWVAEYKNKPVCLAGIYYIKETAIVFSEFKETEINKLTIWRGALMLMDKIKSLGIPVLAVPDECFGRSKEFLERLGFKPANKEGTLYKWQ